MGDIRNINKLVKEYNKDFETIRVASSKELSTVPRVRTNVFVFDLLTGGGIPLWKYIIFHGLKSSGKSTMAYRVINSFLGNFEDKTVILMDFEQSFDNVWASYFIRQDYMDRLLVVTPPTGETGVNMVRDFLLTNEVSLVVVDSLAAIIPAKMAEADAEDNFVGDQARLIAKLLRIPMEHLRRARTMNSPLSILLINQVRVNIGAGAFKSQYVKPCGTLQDFLASLDIRFYEGIYTKVNDIPIKVTHQFKLEKNKICGGLVKRTGEYTMYIADSDTYKTGDIEDEKVVFEYAKRADIIYKEGNKWKVKDSNRQFNNQVEVLETLITDTEFYTGIVDRILKETL